MKKEFTPGVIRKFKQNAPDVVTPIVLPIPKPKPARRLVFAWHGINIMSQFARRPRILRLKASKPKGTGVGEKPLYFPSVYEP